jgi:hypothetical protein
MSRTALTHLLVLVLGGALMAAGDVLTSAPPPPPVVCPDAPPCPVCGGVAPIADPTPATAVEPTP